MPETDPKIKLKALREQQTVVTKLQAQYRDLAKIEGQSVEKDKERKQLIQQINIQTKKTVELHKEYGKTTGKTVQDIADQVDLTKIQNKLERELLTQGKHRNDLAEKWTVMFMSGLEKVTNFIKHIPGGKGMLVKMGLGPKDLKDIEIGMKGAFQSFLKGDIKGAVGKVGGAFKKVNTPMLAMAITAMAIVGIFKLMSGALKTFSATQDKVGAKFGAMGLQKFGKEFQGIFAGTAKFGVDIDRAAEGITALTHGFGMGFKDAIGMVGAVTDLSFALGMSQGEAAGLVGQMTMATGLSKEGAIQLAKQAEMLAVANKKAPAAVMKEVAANTEFFAKYAKEGGKNILIAAIQAGKLGIGLDKTATIMDGLLDFQSSISAEMEASIMLGRTINFQKAREFALEGKSSDAMKEVLSQLGSEQEFMEMNVFQREALAKAINVTTADLAKFVEKGKEGGNVIGNLADQDFTKLIGEDALSGLTQFGNAMEGIGRIFAASVGPMLGMLATGFATAATFIAETGWAMLGLKVIMGALIPVMAVFAAKALYVAVTKIWSGIGQLIALTGGWGLAAAIGAGLGAVAMVHQSVSSTKSLSAGLEADFIASGPTNLLIGESGSPERHTVTKAAPGGGITERTDSALKDLNKHMAAQEKILQLQLQQAEENIKRQEKAIAQGAKDTGKVSAREMIRGALGKGI